MPSGYEGQAIADIDFENLSESDLQKIASEDERSTARETAERELARKEKGTGTSMSETKTKKDTSHGVRRTDLADPDAARERAGASGLTADGLSLEPYDNSEAQAAQDEIDKKGYVGWVPDPTPNENYAASNSTITNDLPTPENDAEMWQKAHNNALGHPLKNVDFAPSELSEDKEESK